MTDLVLGDRIGPCGPVVDAAAAARWLERLKPAVEEGGWAACLDRAWPALAPVFAASPYLAGLARRSPERLRATLETAPEVRLEALLAETLALTGPPVEVRRRCGG